MHAKRRAFLWNDSDKTSGAKCLVTWEKVCRMKTEGYWARHQKAGHIERVPVAKAHPSAAPIRGLLLGGIFRKRNFYFGRLGNDYG